MQICSVFDLFFHISVHTNNDCIFWIHTSYTVIYFTMISAGLIGETCLPPPCFGLLSILCNIPSSSMET